MPRPRGMSQTLWFLTNPGMARGMGGEDTLNPCGWNGFQSELVVVPTPFQLHRSSQPLCKEFLRIKRHPISHDVVGSPGQFMGESAVGDHEVGSCCFPLVIGSGIRVITPGKFGSLREGPCEILVAVFLIALAVCLTVTVYRSTIIGHPVRHFSRGLLHGRELFFPDLSRGLVPMALDQPMGVVEILELKQREAEFLDGSHGLYP